MRDLSKDPIAIAIDFDGTCVTHEYPAIGKDIGAIPVLQEIQKYHKLILYTMRGFGREIEAAQYLQERGIVLWGINNNPTQQSWTNSPKVLADVYIDDCALGVPLKRDLTLSPRPFVDWEKVEKLLKEQNYI